MPPVWRFCAELSGGRVGTPFDITGGQNRAFRREYQRKWRVIVGSPLVTPTLVAACPALPYPYTPYFTTAGIYDYDLYAYLVKRTAEPEHQDDWQNWIVTDTYSTDVPGGVVEAADLGNNSSPGGHSNNPEMEYPEITYAPEEETWAPPTDLAGKPFLNTAGDPFNPAPQLPRANTILTYSRNEIGFNIQKAMAYNYSLNSKTFCGFPPSSVMCLPPAAVTKWKGPVKYARVTYRFRFKAMELYPASVDPFTGDVLTDGNGDIELGLKFGKWEYKILNQGTRALTVDSPNKAMPIWRGTGFITNPALLKENGREAAKTDPPYYVPFTTWTKQDFNRLLVRGIGG